MRAWPGRPSIRRRCKTRNAEPKKQAKLNRRSERLYDCILVGPVALPLAEGVHDARTPIAPHWRRGLVRWQVHGPKNSLRKIIFTAPILVGSARVNGQPAGPKDYRVR